MNSGFNRMMPLPRIAVTMGDPAGVGPEICLRLLADRTIQKHCIPVVLGDAGVLSRAAQVCRLPVPARVIPFAEGKLDLAELPAGGVLDLQTIPAESFQPSRVDGQTGQAAYRYIEAAIDLALTNQVQAVTTAPIHKKALHAAGIDFPGHTEIFASKTKAKRTCMMLASPQLTCSFVTLHVGYSEVAKLLSVERVQEVIELTAAGMRRLRGREPSLLVCGLNPHAGEEGLFGDREEERFIVPAVAAAQAQGLQVEGPLPPDTAFLNRRRRESDAVVCMYHDQGHIVMKALAFEHAVNVTLGLPIIRTSVGHGTALDIAWQGQADPQSLRAAVLFAARLASPDRPTT